jgi:hypothetical protein
MHGEFHEIYRVDSKHYKSSRAICGRRARRGGMHNLRCRGRQISPKERTNRATIQRPADTAGWERLRILQMGMAIVLVCNRTKIGQAPGLPLLSNHRACFPEGIFQADCKPGGGKRNVADADAFRPKHRTGPEFTHQMEPGVSAGAAWRCRACPQRWCDAGWAGRRWRRVVDRNRNPIFYTIHVNSVFADFVQANQLDDMERMLADPSATAKKPVPADLEFRPGAMEFKSSWMILDGPISEHPNYITTRARIPVLKNEPNKNAPGTHLVVDTAKRLREVNVALLGLHVVGVIDGHPEFIWATFEHADDKTGARDVAPAAHDNPAPSNTPPQTIDGSNKDYPLFKANTAVDKADTPINQPVGTDQKFANGTPVFRVFPGSASKKPDDTPPGQMEDPAITALNQQMTRLFSTNDPRGKDWRRHYRLVGAIWLDQPRKDDAFKEGAIFGADDVKLAGDNRLSNVSIESFTQIGAPHCFSCHNTDAQDQDLDGKVLPARLINISHIFTIVAKKYLSSLKQ